MKNYSTTKRYFEDKLIYSTKHPDYIYQNKDLTVISSHEDSLYFGYVVTPSHTGTCCRSCGQLIFNIKDTRISYPTIGIINDKPVVLKLIRKLYFCHDCNCSTIHQVDGLLSHAQTSIQLKDQIIKEVVNKKQTYSQAARRFKTSVSTVIRYFDRKEVRPVDFSSITHVSIDETKLIPNAGNYQFVVTNALNGSILAILPNRLAPLVSTFMHDHFPNLEVITQDFWDTYRSAGVNHKACPQIVVDRFHFVRFAMWAYNRTRVELQKQKQLRLMKTWKLQNKSRKKLSKKSKRKVDQIIKQDKQLYLAYKAKEFFLHLSRIRDLEAFREGIKKWRALVEKHQLHHFYSIFTTLDNWHKEIENMVISPYSNGGAERANRTMKQAKNQAFGYRNLTRTEKLMILRTSSTH
jgi:transposase